MVNFEENTLEEKWELKRISEFFYLLVDASDPSGKDILQKRFKKEPDIIAELYSLIIEIEELSSRSVHRVLIRSKVLART